MKKLILITGALSILVLSACTDTPQTTQTEPETSTPTNTTDTPTTPEVADATTYSEADRAAYSGALQLKDETFCDKISNEGYKAECKVVVLDQINLQEAITSLDASLCDKLSTDDKKEACKVQVEVVAVQNDKIAKQKAEHDESQEKLLKVQDEGTIEECDTIINNEMVNICKDYFIFKKATENQQSVDCEKLSSESGIQLCKETITEMQKSS